MSSKYYKNQWLTAVNDLKSIVAAEKLIQNLSPESIRLTAHGIIASVYSRFIVLVNNLSNIYDQMLQCQRREIIEKLLEASTKRLLELKKELCQIEMSEFIYIDATLIQQQLLPQDVQLSRPFHFPYQRSSEIQVLIDEFHMRVDDKQVADDDEHKSDVSDTAANVAEVTSAVETDNGNMRKSLQNNRSMELKESSVQSITNQVDISYEFQYDECTEPLIAINKTEFKQNFYQESKASNFEFYKNPMKKNEEVKDDRDNDAVLATQTTQTFHAPKKCRGALLFNSTEWLLAQTAEVKKTESEVLRERNQRNRELAAANLIKAAWTRYRFRKWLKERTLQKYQLLGMVQNFKEPTQAIGDLMKVRDIRRAKKQLFNAEYITIFANLKAKIMEQKTPVIENDIGDHLRQWFAEMYDAIKQFQDFPPQAKGGSKAILLGDTMTADEFVEYIKYRESKTADERKRDADEAKAEKAKEKESLKKLEAEKARQALKDGPSWDFADKKFVTQTFENLVDVLNEYESGWKCFDQNHGASDQPILELIELDVYAQLNQDLRTGVDEKMRMELEALKMALCEDRGTKYKKKNEKRDKGKKGGKKKKLEEPLDHSTVVSMFNELVDGNVLINYPEVSLDDYIADFNYVAYDLRHFGAIENDPSFGGMEMKQVLRTWMLGMGPLTIEKPVSICIAGPPGCGKKMLVHAMATELNAVILNLSASIVHQFENSIDQFAYSIKRMSKTLEPTIIFIDQVHKAFSAKLTKEDQELNVKLIAKFLPTLRKCIKPDDKIMLIGTTNEPWLANAKQMEKIFEKRLLCPSNDYSLTFQLWRNGIGRKLRTDPMISLSSLARVTTKYAAADILACIELVLNDKRMRRLKFIPLQADEFLDNLILSSKPLPDAQLDKYRVWFSRSNALEKLRTKYKKQLLAANTKKKS